MNTSLWRIRSRSSSLPVSVLRSMVIERLLALRLMKYMESIPASLDAKRFGSPVPGVSTLITSAPSHASASVVEVPDSKRVRSTTR